MGIARSLPAVQLHVLGFALDIGFCWLFSNQDLPFNAHSLHLH